MIQPEGKIEFENLVDKFETFEYADNINNSKSSKQYKCKERKEYIIDTL